MKTFIFFPWHLTQVVPGVFLWLKHLWNSSFNMMRNCTVALFQMSSTFSTHPSTMNFQYRKEIKVVCRVLHLHNSVFCKNEEFFWNKQNLFSEFFPWMWTLNCLGLIYCKNYFNYSKIFVLKLFNRGLSPNFQWLRSANLVKFPEEFMICMEKLALVTKLFTNRLNKVWFLCFNGISTLFRLFNAKAILLEEQ